MLLGPILGPVIGGVLVDNASWRWIFYVNIPIAIFALGLASKVLHADAGRADAGRLDVTGLALVSPGLAGIVFGLSESESHGGFGAPIVWAPIVAGAVLVALFVRHAWFADRPLVDVKLFRNGGFGAAAGAAFLLGGALFGTLLILPLYYQVARGEDALTAGLLMAPQGIGAAMAMPLAGRLTDRIGGGIVALFGIVVMTLGTLPFAFVGADTSYPLLAGLLVVRGLGLGSSMMPSMAAAYALLSPAAVPRATSALTVTRQVGGSIGTAILAVTLQGQIKDALGGGAGGGGLGQIPEPLRQSHAAALADAFAHTFWLAIGMSVLAIVPIALLAWTTRPGGRDDYAGEHGPGDVSPSPVHGRAPATAGGSPALRRD
jgi:EmrB/QacA subfamily drug resistance transporter